MRLAQALSIKCARASALIAEPRGWVWQKPDVMHRRCLFVHDGLSLKQDRHAPPTHLASWLLSTDGAFTLRLVCVLSASSLRLLFVYSSSTLRLLFVYSAFTLHLLGIYSSSTGRLLGVYFTVAAPLSSLKEHAQSTLRQAR